LKTEAACNTDTAIAQGTKYRGATTKIIKLMETTISPM
jgi:hypothetical protein